MDAGAFLWDTWNMGAKVIVSGIVGAILLGLWAVLSALARQDAHPPYPLPAPAVYGVSCPPRDTPMSEFEVRHFRLSSTGCLCVLMRDNAVISYSFLCEN